MEEWRKIKDFPRYEVSNMGRVRHIETGNIPIFSKNAKGYYQLSIRNYERKIKCVKIHRLVAQAFIPNPEDKPQVNHKDCNKKNNKVDNLEWATNGENQTHAFANDLQDNKGEKHPRHILTEEEVVDIYTSILDEKCSQVSLAVKYGVSKGTISSIKHKRNWSYLTDKIDKERVN